MVRRKPDHSSVAELLSELNQTPKVVLPANKPSSWIAYNDERKQAGTASSTLKTNRQSSKRLALKVKQVQARESALSRIITWAYKKTKQ